VRKAGQNCSYNWERLQGGPYYYQDDQGRIIVRRPAIEVHGSVGIVHLISEGSPLDFPSGEGKT